MCLGFKTCFLEITFVPSICSIYIPDVILKRRLDIQKKIHPPPLFDESEQVVKNPIKRRFSCNGSLMRRLQSIRMIPLHIHFIN